MEASIAKYGPAIIEAQWDTSNPRALWKCISRLKGKLSGCGEISLMSFRNQGYMLEILNVDSEN